MNFTSRLLSEFSRYRADGLHGVLTNFLLDVRATRAPGAIDCSCLASAAPTKKVRLVIMAVCLPVESVVIEVTCRVTESPCTDSTTPVAMPHWESQPLLGGKMLQLQVVGEGGG